MEDSVPQVAPARTSLRPTLAMGGTPDSAVAVARDP
jgi:hypothetical protein